MFDAAYLSHVTPEAPIARRDLVSPGALVLSHLVLFVLVCTVVSESMMRTAKSAISQAGLTCSDWPTCTGLDPTADLVFYGFYPAITVWNGINITLASILSAVLVWVIGRMKTGRVRPFRIQAFAAVIPFGILASMGTGLAIAYWGPSFYLACIHKTWALFLVAYTTWLIVRLQRPDVRWRAGAGWKSYLIAIPTLLAAVATIRLGVMIAHLDDLANNALPFGIDPATLPPAHTGATIALVIMVSLGTIWTTKCSVPVIRQARGTWTALLVVLAIETALGIAQALLPMPVWTAELHAFGGTLIVIGTVVAIARLFPRIPVLALSPGASPTLKA